MIISSQINAWKREIDEITADCLQSFEPLSTEELNWKPNAAKWSVAQNLQHLITINRSYFPIIQQLKEGLYQAPFWARFPFLTRYFGKMILKAVEPQAQKKTKTFPVWEPQTGNIDKSIVPDFVMHQEELKGQLATSADFIVNGEVIASPASKLVVYPLATAFEVIVTHEKRHMNQARELLQWQHDKAIKQG